ncbi:MAG: hypothetical protein WA116_06695 [Anaerolineaceae bacterium]
MSEQTRDTSAREETQEVAQNKLPQAGKYGCCGPSNGLALRYGEPCPFCLTGRVDYDGLLNLVCLNCGKTQTGVFT